jgi:hypothetical protein
MTNKSQNSKNKNTFGTFVMNFIGALAQDMYEHHFLNPDRPKKKDDDDNHRGGYHDDKDAPRLQPILVYNRHQP